MVCGTAAAVTFPSSAYTGSGSADVGTVEISTSGTLVTGSFEIQSVGGTCSGAADCGTCCYPILEPCVTSGDPEPCQNEFLACMRECEGGPSLPADCGLGFSLAVIAGYAVFRRRKEANR